MEEPEKGLSTRGTSESTVTHDEKAGVETLEGSLVCGGQVQIEGSFSGELVGDGGACNGKDVMVEVLGTDVYIDGVCTRESGAELNEQVGCGGSVEGGEDLGEDVKSVGAGCGSEARFEDSKAVESEDARSKNATEERDQAMVGSDQFDVASLQEDSLLDNRAQKEVETGVSDSFSVGNTMSGKTEAPIEADVGAECKNALDAGVLDHTVTSTIYDSSLTVGSVGGENVQSRWAEKDDQKERNLIDIGVPGDGNDVTLKTLDEQKNIANWQNDKLLEKEACNCDKVEFEEKLNSVGEQPIGIDKVDGNSNNILEEVVGGTEVATDKPLLNSEEKQSFSLEKCTEKEWMTDSSKVSSDTGQGIVDKDKEVKLNKNVFYAEQCSLHKGIEIEVEDRNESDKTNIMNHTAEIKGTLISLGSEKNLDASEISMIVEEDTQISDQGYVAQMGAGKEKFPDESNTRQNDEVQPCVSGQVASNGGQDIEVEELNKADQRKITDGKVIKHLYMKPGSSEICHRYSLPKEKEGKFSVSDMVWGKVRSHPWWPGQIFHPSDSSEKAMKHYKKDCYLLAYFGDRTFAWNEASQLKSFRTHFSSIVKQSASESFQNSVDCALDEITRRVEFGLACFCIPKDTYDTIQFQTVENAGIRPDITLRHGVDESLNASSFSPDKLIEYLKILSEFPTGGFDRLELVIAKAQLLAFYRFKGYSCLPELQYYGGFDNDTDTISYDGEKKLSEVTEHATPIIKKDGAAGTGNLKSQSNSRHKRKHNLKDTVHPTKKERRMSDLMGGTPDSPGDDYWYDEKVTDDLVSPGHSKKRRTIDQYADDSGMQDGRKTISLAKVSNTSKPSFKIGDCIRRVASQLTGTPSTLKCSGDRSQKTDGSTDGFSGNGSDDLFRDFEEAQRLSVTVPTEYSSLDDLLYSLQLVAQEPLGDYSFLNGIVSFFSDFRNSVIVADESVKEIFRMDKVGAKRKKPPIAGSPETFEFEDMSDTYWTDRVIDNGSEEQPAQPPRKNRKKDSQLVPAEPGKPVQVNRRSYTRKQYSDSINAEAPEKPSGYIDENSPAELVMNFAELDSVPSETSLNKMFRRFGPLKESETEVDRVSSRARVVFKKCADAEVACSSAKKFNIFGGILVNYQLNYTPSALFKASSVTTTQDQEMHLDLSNFEVNMV
ncbi:PWWP domain-containing protein 3-like [Gastrolobium bilobum]|uniref:PWWP domain-containing protein 3-like n=1 Tax=Gastrolobium bilobum TaxID=150636 RepID=UPI002AAF3A7F|nr:PWWP domain-containing protein 3-like [Gastrolobium bilobum]